MSITREAIVARLMRFLQQCEAHYYKAGSSTIAINRIARMKVNTNSLWNRDLSGACRYIVENKSAFETSLPPVTAPTFDSCDHLLKAVLRDCNTVVNPNA